MIVSFKHKGLRNFFETDKVKGINPEHSKKLRRILSRLDAAEDIKDMNYPGSRLHLLEPKQDGIWSVRVSGNWRVTFVFEGGKVYDIDYLDYHS